MTAQETLDHASAYEAVRTRITELALRGPEAAVPATPGWTVHDLVAHLAGLAVDWANARLGGYASAGWTAAHVESRRGRDLASVLEEWAAAAPRVAEILRDPASAALPDPLMTAFGPVASDAWPDIIVTDAALHEHDLRGALDLPGARWSDAVEIGMRSHVGLLRFVGAARGLPSIELCATDTGRRYTIGRDDPGGALNAPLFELFRATGGRRSAAQIAALDWTGETGTWPAHLVMPSYAVPEDDLVE